MATLKRPKDQGSLAPTVTFTYTLSGKLKKENYTATDTPDVTYNYEAYAPGRLSSVVDGIGTHAFTYHPFPTTLPGDTGLAGAGQIASVNGAMAEDDFTYLYDWQDRPGMNREDR